jgi:fructosamine-3-kinase
MTPELASALESALGQRIATAERVGGGDINEAFCVTLADGCKLFVKAHRKAKTAMFRAEARGLRWLSEARALSVPEVLAYGKLSGIQEEGIGGFLALEWVNYGLRKSFFDEHLGRGLAALHRFGAPCFGFESDNYIGLLPQSNHHAERFSDFYREQRLMPLVNRALHLGRFDARLHQDFELLYARLPELLGAEEPPSRLHGDLWSGNLLSGPDGEPWLIDPAVYGGNRELDLAMMRLFGGFSERVFESYDEAFPLLPGHEERVQLLQLYPLLVHACHFGGSYVSQVRRVLTRYL